MTFVGAATTHTTAQNLTNLTITFLNGAFSNSVAAANVLGYTNATGTVTFVDAGTGSVTYSAAIFAESTANDGSISNQLTLTLAGDIWETDVAVNNGVTVTNLPTGLFATVVRTSPTVLTMYLVGSATSHLDANGITNLTVTLTDDAFDTLQAINVTTATKNDLVIDFADAAAATLTYSSSTFTESVTNNGQISTSIPVTIAGGGTFGATLTAGTDVVFTNVPAGLTGAVTRVSATQATLTLTGTAAAHADITNDIANLTTTWANSAFSGVLAANVTGATNTGIAVDFRDITLAYATTTFPEVAANNGTISTTSALTLT